MHLHHFLPLPTHKIREIVMQDGPTTCGFVINGSRRWYMFEHHTKKEDFSKDYLDTINRRTIEILKMFFDHGVSTMIMPILSPHILQKRSARYAKMAMHAIEQLTLHPLYLELYDAYDIQVRFYGNYRAYLDDQLGDELASKADALRTRTKDHQACKIFFGVCAHDATDDIARTSIDHYIEHGTVPTKDDLIKQYYGEALNPIDLYISSSKPSVVDIPLISNGRESLYFTVAPSPYMTVKQFRTILHDHIYNRGATRNRYVIDQTNVDQEQGWEDLKRFYESNRESTIGIGHRSLSGIWHPLPQVQVPQSVDLPLAPLTQTAREDVQVNLFAELARLIEEAGPGHNTVTAYDTAWVARLQEELPDIAYEAIEWLRSHQLPDGSWGMFKPVYHHDRVLCTLAAVIALRKNGNIRDRDAVARGLFALHDHLERLDADLAGPTAGFEMILPALIDEAVEIGLLPPIDEDFLAPLQAKRQRKIEMTPAGLINREVTIAFSAEMAGADGKKILDADNLLEKNGSVGLSPSATAYYLLHLKPNDEQAKAYLRAVWQDGMPNFAPFDYYEQAWIVWNLMLADLDGLPTVRAGLNRFLDTLYSAWQPGRGIGFSDSFTPVDGDDSAVAFEALIRAGYEMPIEDLFYYEEETHFRTFNLETHSSVGTNVHMLAALRAAGLAHDDPSIVKILNYLYQTRIDQSYWVDKWHISPYYITSHVVIACSDFDLEISTPSVDWILASQFSNGGWGWTQPTAEETAFCIQALTIWEKNGHEVERDVIQRGVNWMVNHIHDPMLPMWTAKCLYSPERVIQSAILSALLLAKSAGYSISEIAHLEGHLDA